MRDPVTGRLRRGPGEPERFSYAEVEIPSGINSRINWLREQTGYDCDSRTVYISEALRATWFRERAQHLKKDRLPSTSTLRVQELRTSERKTFGTCAQQWWWRYVEWLTPMRKATPLWFGSAMHEGWAAYYRPGLKRGPHPAETFSNVLDGERKTWTKPTEDDEAKFVDARALGVDMMNHYVETYGADPRYYVLATEKTFALTFKRKGSLTLKYLLTIDGLIRDMETGQIKILEHKTARDFGIVKNLPLDNQAGSYYAAAPYVLPLEKLLKPGEKISGIEYNIARKAMRDERPRNADGHYTNKPEKRHYLEALTGLPDGDGTSAAKMKLDELEVMAERHGITVHGDVSKTQPQPYFLREQVFRTAEEQKVQLQRIQNEALYMEGMRSGDPAYPVLKTPGDHCNWCPFRHLCELHESGDNDAVESYKVATMKIEDPHLAYHKHPKAA